MARRWTTESFTEFVSNNSECELLSEEYVHCNTKLRFRCKCGNEFETAPKTFLGKGKRHCDECGKEKQMVGLEEFRKNSSYTYEFVRSFISNDGNVLLNKEYFGIKCHIEIKCKCGNEFKTTFDSYKNGGKRQCNECSKLISNRTKQSRKRSRNKKSTAPYTYEEVQRIINSTNGCTLLSEQYVGVKTNLVIRCKCGELFKTTFDCFRSKNKFRCGKCSGKQSAGETRIENWLLSKGVKFQKQYRIRGCRHKKPLPFDFAIFKDDLLECLVEYDGEQHFRPYRFQDNQLMEYVKFKKVQERDEIKNNYCKDNNIKLVRIPYTNLNNIESILETIV